MQWTPAHDSVEADDDHNDKSESAEIDNDDDLVSIKDWYTGQFAEVHQDFLYVTFACVDEQFQAHNLWKVLPEVFWLCEPGGGKDFLDVTHACVDEQFQAHQLWKVLPEVEWFWEPGGGIDFLDVTLACVDEQIQAHKVILSAGFSFF